MKRSTVFVICQDVWESHTDGIIRKVIERHFRKKKCTSKRGGRYNRFIKEMK